MQESSGTGLPSIRGYGSLGSNPAVQISRFKFLTFEFLSLKFLRFTFLSFKSLKFKLLSFKFLRSDS